MGSLIVEVVDPCMQIGLQFFQAEIQLLSERDLVELLQDGFMKSFADVVCLWMAHFGFGVFNVIECQVEWVVMRLRLAAVLGAAVGQDAANALDDVDVEGVLRTKITRMDRFDFALRDLIILLLLQSRQPTLDEDRELRSYARGETKIPRWRNSLLART